MSRLLALILATAAPVLASAAEPESSTAPTEAAPIALPGPSPKSAEEICSRPDFASIALSRLNETDRKDLEFQFFGLRDTGQTKARDFDEYLQEWGSKFCTRNKGWKTIPSLNGGYREIYAFSQSGKEYSRTYRLKPPKGSNWKFCQLTYTPEVKRYGAYSILPTYGEAVPPNKLRPIIEYTAYLHTGGGGRDDPSGVKLKDFVALWVDASADDALMQGLACTTTAANTLRPAPPPVQPTPRLPITPDVLMVVCEGRLALLKGSDSSKLLTRALAPLNFSVNWSQNGKLVTQSFKSVPRGHEENFYSSEPGRTVGYTCDAT